MKNKQKSSQVVMKGDDTVMRTSPVGFYKTVFKVANVVFPLMMLGLIISASLNLVDLLIFMWFLVYFIVYWDTPRFFMILDEKGLTYRLGFLSRTYFYRYDQIEWISYLAKVGFTLYFRDKRSMRFMISSDNFDEFVAELEKRVERSKKGKGPFAKS